MASTSLIVLGLMCIFAADAANLKPKANEPPTIQLKLVVTVDGKSFFADSTILRSWTDARDYCASVGMKQGQITSTAQAQALMASHSVDFTGQYWTAGRDAMTYRQFSWDMTNAEVGAYLPFNPTNPISCLVLGVLSNEAHYSNADCHDQLGTLCET